jgi:hypothetical protein
MSKTFYPSLRVRKSTRQRMRYEAAKPIVRHFDLQVQKIEPFRFPKAERWAKSYENSWLLLPKGADCATFDPYAPEKPLFQVAGKLAQGLAPFERIMRGTGDRDDRLHVATILDLFGIKRNRPVTTNDHQDLPDRPYKAPVPSEPAPYTPPMPSEPDERDSDYKGEPSQPMPDKPATGDDRVGNALLDLLGPSIEKRFQAIEKKFALDPEEINRQIEEALDPDAIYKRVDAVIAARKPERIVVSLPDQPDIEVKGQHEVFPAVLRELALRHRVFIAGPAGSGKTTGVEKAAEALGAELFVQPPVADRFELLGFVDAGGTYQPSPAYLAVKAANEGRKVLLLFDEMDRSHPNSLTALHMLLGNGIAVFPNGQLAIKGENMYIAATANTWGLGADAEYVGACKLDAATLNRFQTRLTWGYDLEFESDLACKLHHGTPARVAECVKVREKLAESAIRLVWGPRDTFAFCTRRESGQTRAQAFEVSALAALRPDQLKKVLS